MQHEEGSGSAAVLFITATSCWLNTPGAARGAEGSPGEQSTGFITHHDIMAAQNRL